MNQAHVCENFEFSLLLSTNLRKLKLFLVTQDHVEILTKMLSKGRHVENEYILFFVALGLFFID
jgi:hypothetical protein